MQPEQRNKLVLFGVVAGFVGLILLVWFFISGPGSRVSVEVYVVPSDTTVTMDGKEIDVNNGKISISKGKHTFVGTREHFGSETQEIDTANLPENDTVYLALYPNSPEGEEFLENNPQEEHRYERVGGSAFNAVTDKLLEDYPFTNELPYETLDYKIDYDVSADRKTVNFLVKLYEPAAVTAGSDLYKQELNASKEKALDYLRDNGVDLNSDEVKVIFTPDPDNL